MKPNPLLDWSHLNHRRGSPEFEKQKLETSCSETPNIENNKKGGCYVDLWVRTKWRSGCKSNGQGSFNKGHGWEAIMDDLWKSYRTTTFRRPLLNPPLVMTWVNVKTQVGEEEMSKRASRETNHKETASWEGEGLWTKKKKTRLMDGSQRQRGDANRVQGQLGFLKRTP